MKKRKRIKAETKRNIELKFYTNDYIYGILSAIADANNLTLSSTVYQMILDTIYNESNLDLKTTIPHRF